MSRLCRADLSCWSRGAATPETEVVAASLAVSLTERAERVLRLLEDLWRRAEVGIGYAAEPVP